MGLFDPPTKTMAKYAPVSVQPMLAGVRIFAEDAVPDSIGATKKALIVAMTMGAWISAHAQLGSFDMSKRDLDQVQLLYTNCARLAGNFAALIGPIVTELCNQGVMPEEAREFYSH